MRIGLLEMKRFSQEFFEGIRDSTFVEESAGVADLITSCLGGRNRKCAEAFVTSGKVSMLFFPSQNWLTFLHSRSRSISSRRRCSRGRSCKAYRPLGSFMVRPPLPSASSVELIYLSRQLSSKLAAKSTITLSLPSLCVSLL